MFTGEINPFDILSGKVIRYWRGTFWFKEPGNNINKNRDPIMSNLHRENDLPAVIWNNGDKWWYKAGNLHRTTGPAIIETNGDVEYWVDNKRLTEEDFTVRIKCLQEK